MKYALNKYKYARTGNKVIAISTYAGRTVKGVAKTDPRDTFSLEDGKKLAAARCNAKIAIKRAKNAEFQLIRAKEALEQAEARLAGCRRKVDPRVPPILQYVQVR